MSGSGISWAVCKSAPRSRQITTPALHHSGFTGRMPFLPPNQQHQSHFTVKHNVSCDIVIGSLTVAGRAVVVAVPTPLSVGYTRSSPAGDLRAPWPRQAQPCDVPRAHDPVPPAPGHVPSYLRPTSDRHHRYRPTQVNSALHPSGVA